MRLSLEYDGIESSLELTNETLVTYLKSSNNPVQELTRILDNGYLTFQLIPPSKVVCGCCHKIDGSSKSVETFTDLVNTGGEIFQKRQIM